MWYFIATTILMGIVVLSTFITLLAHMGFKAEMKICSLIAGLINIVAMPLWVIISIIKLITMIV